MTAADFLREAATLMREWAVGPIALAVADLLDAEAFVAEAYPEHCKLLAAIIADVTGREVRLEARHSPGDGYHATADTRPHALALAAAVLGREWTP